MPNSFTIFEILIIIGISQGLVTSFLLLSSKESSKSKRILGITVLFFCIANCRILLHTSGLWDVAILRYFPVGMELLLPPLVYLYVLSLTETDFKIKKSYIFQLIPGLLYAFYDITLYLLTLNYESLEAKRQLANQLYFDEINLFEDYLIVVLTLIYVVLGYKKIRAFLSWLKQFKEYKSLPIYGWLRSLIIWSSILWGVLMVNQLMSAFSLAMEEPMYRWRFFNLFFAFMTYYLGFVGYKKEGLSVHLSKSKLTSLANKLSKSQEQEIEQSLLKKLEDDTVYLDSSITLKQLATDLGVTSESLSLVINQTFEMGFRDLINSYRVTHIKKQLKRMKNPSLSILELALDSGFNSQASFYRAFKKFEGVSPKAYLAQFS